MELSFGLYIFTLFFIWYKFGLFKLSTLYIIYFAAGTLMANSNLMEKIFTNQMVSTLSLLCVFLLMAFWTPGETSLIKIIIRIAVSFSVISITYFLCTKLSWNKYWDSLIVSFGKYSLGIYVMHWTFLNIWETKPLIVQNELIGFAPLLLYAILICIVCILFMKIISYSSILNSILFGNKISKQ